MLGITVSIILPLFAFAQIGNNPAARPHGCKNFGVCALDYVPEANLSYVDCPSGSCVCNKGTSGDTCEILDDSCKGVNCGKSHIHCENLIGDYECVCDTGWTGSNCDTDVNSICATEPCYNNGKCKQINNATFECECPKDYLPPLCKYKNPCNNQCGNGGTCKAMYDGADFKCECTSDWTGKGCGWRRSALVKNSERYAGCYEVDVGLLLDKGKYYGVVEKTMSITRCKEWIEYLFPSYQYFSIMDNTCYMSPVNYLKKKAPNSDGNCKKECSGNKKEQCGTTDRVVVYEYSETVSDPNDCDGKQCGESDGRGFCFDTHKDSGKPYECSCNPEYETKNATYPCDFKKPLPCEDDPCLNGECVVVRDSYRCDCEPGFFGTNCDFATACNATICKYGGACVENNDGKISCDCLEWYTGTYCTEVNICDYGNPCVHGKCKELGKGIRINYTCECDKGYDGYNCEKEVDFCARDKPCLWGGSCTPQFLDYKCNCIDGTTGRNCEIWTDQCNKTRNNDNKEVNSQCNKKDKDAICTSLLNDWNCTCSKEWTGKNCDLNILIEKVLLIVYGEVNYAMIPMLEDLLKNPAMIKDMVPFFIGMQPNENRTQLSWTHEDLFDWATYEQKPLELEKDLHLWNDVVLGNCFTFNHMETDFMYKMRMSGDVGGFKALMKVQQREEFPPWAETAAIMVFVHNKDEYIFSESVRYNAEPFGDIRLFVKDTRYSRLAGRYGKCVVEPKEVKAYYYTGMYTTDGCLRSCIQDMLQEECGCMDPRYPMPEGAQTCALVQRDCIDEATEVKGDPTKWDNCECPLPCTNQQYSVQWSRSKNVEYIPDCVASNYTDLNCTKNHNDTVLITVNLPDLTYFMYAETPAMDINRFISNLGGLLGVLMGVSIYAFIEVVFLIFTCCYICCCFKKTKKD